MIQGIGRDGEKAEVVGGKDCGYRHDNYRDGDSWKPVDVATEQTEGDGLLLFAEGVEQR